MGIQHIPLVHQPRRHPDHYSILRKFLDLKEANVRKFAFGTWTAMSMFACLALQGDPNSLLPDRSLMVRDALLQSSTEVWTQWRKASPNPPVPHDAFDAVYIRLPKATLPVPRNDF
ncbi:hypothetical protein V8D89_007070 [Ganoderma adspersum]